MRPKMLASTHLMRLNVSFDVFSISFGKQKQRTKENREDFHCPGNYETFPTKLNYLYEVPDTPRIFLLNCALNRRKKAKSC